MLFYYGSTDQYQQGIYFKPSGQHREHVDEFERIREHAHVVGWTKRTECRADIAHHAECRSYRREGVESVNRADKRDDGGDQEVGKDE